MTDDVPSAVEAYRDELADAVTELATGAVVRVPSTWRAKAEHGRNVVVASDGGRLDPVTLSVGMALAERHTATVTVLESPRSIDSALGTVGGIGTAADARLAKAAQQETLDMQLAPYGAAGCPPVVAEVASEGLIDALRRMHRSIGVLVVAMPSGLMPSASMPSGFGPSRFGDHPVVTLALHELGVPVVIVPG